MSCGACCPTGTTTSLPDLRDGRVVLVGAHGNSLRALVKHLDGISDEDIAALNIPTGIPLLYRLDSDLRPIVPGGEYLDPKPPRAPPRPSRTRAGSRRMGTALVTGGTSGIGLSIARQLAGHGHDLVIVARDQERLDKVAGEISRQFRVTCEALSVDLSDEQACAGLEARIADPDLPLGGSSTMPGSGSPTHSPRRRSRRNSRNSTYSSGLR